jgi:carbon-monoxide dehydrogenase small subunit
MTTHAITLTVNGRQRETTVPARLLLSDCLRHTLGLPGTHVGCEHGVCGACTVLMDGRAVRSCLTFAVQADGSRLTTIEGLANGAQLHPIQEAFWEEHGLQCGFCTPGMVMSAVDLAKTNPNASEHEIREWLEGNICRCTGYHNIVKSIQAGAAAMQAAK